MDHFHPVMVEALRGQWPHIAPGTAPEEAQRVAADLEHQQHREASRVHRALVDQVQHLQNTGVLS
jgi:hypothetical protein